MASLGARWQKMKSCCLNFHYGYGFGECEKLFDFGYTAEHFRVGLQFAVACGLAALFMAVDSVRNFYNTSPLWIFIIMSIIMEPLVGKALKKGLATIAGTFLGAGVGSAVAAAWETICYDKEHQGGFQSCGKGMTSAAVVVGGFFLMVNQMRFPEYADSFKAALIMYFACIYFPELRPFPAGLISLHVEGINASFYIYKAKIALAAITGVAVICLVSLFIFPNTAGRRVKRQSEHILERLGNLSFAALGEFCQEPDKEMRIPGTTGTDVHLRFVDDGLEKKYSMLMQQLQVLGDDIYQATELLPSARAELTISLRWWRSPRFPVDSYGFIFKCASNILTSLLAIVTTLHDGSVRLGLCVRHHDLMDDVRQDISTAFTALAGLIHRTSTEEYVAEKFRNMADALVELYHGVSAAPQNAYDSEMETFAIFTKSAIGLARQNALIFRELSPLKGKSMHAYIAASFAQTLDNTGPGMPMSRQGSLATLDRGIRLGKAATMSGLFKHPNEHHLTNMMLDRVQSFHADDNPFETEDNGQYIGRSWSVESQVPNSIHSSLNTGEFRSRLNTTDSRAVAGDSLPGTPKRAASLLSSVGTGYHSSRRSSRTYGRDVSPGNTLHGSLERVSEEDALQRSNSQDERMSDMALMRHYSSKSQSSDLRALKDDNGWDETTIRKHLLGKLLTRRGTDDTAIRREQLRAQQVAEAVNPPPIRFRDTDVLERGQDPPGRRTYARVPSKKRASRDFSSAGSDWRGSGSFDWNLSRALNSSKHRTSTLLDSLDVPWDANFVRRRLELASLSSTNPSSSLGDGGSNASGSLPARSSPKLLSSGADDVPASDMEGNSPESGLQTVQEEPAPVNPSRRLKKARTFSEYTRLWRASEDGPLKEQETIPSRPPIRPIRTACAAANNDVTVLVVPNGHAAGHNEAHNPNLDSQLSQFDTTVINAAQELSQSQRASEDLGKQEEGNDSWKRLKEVNFETMLVPVSPIMYNDSESRAVSMRQTGASDSVSTTRSVSTTSEGNGPPNPQHSVGSVRRFRGQRPRDTERDRRFSASGSLARDMTRSYGSNQSWKQDSLGALTAPKREDPMSRQGSSKRGSAAEQNRELTKADSKRELRSVVMQEGRVKNWNEWQSESSDSELRAWLRAPHAGALRRISVETSRPPPREAEATVALRRPQRATSDLGSSLVAQAMKPAKRILRPNASDLGRREPTAAELAALQSAEWDPEATQNLLRTAIPERRNLSTSIINKEVWNLEEDEDNSHAGSDCEPELDEPNLDFVAVKINDWSDPPPKSRGRKSGHYARNMRGVEENVDRAKHSVLEAARNFWEARLRLHTWDT